MKTLLKVFITFFLVSAIFQKQASAQQSNVSFQVFYDELSPYGEWVNYPDYGFVWIPDAGPDFEPYSTQGHWLLTDYGWTWMSDYSWGWAPFHYGRWDSDPNLGWFWVPGNEWGPAWVSWRRAEGYYGWAPMEPGISVSASFGRPYDRDRDHWIFVRDRDIDRYDLNQYYVSRNDHDRIVNRSSVVNNTYNDNRRHTTYVTGPARGDFQKATGKEVNPVAIEEYNKPGQNYSDGRVQMYRPEVIRNNNSGRNDAPSKVISASEVRKPSERKNTNQNGNLNPSNNSRREVSPVKDNSQGNVRDTKSDATRQANPNTRPQNANPQENIRHETPVNSNQQNTNPPENVRKDVRQDNVKSQNTNPQQDLKREAPPVDVKQQNMNQQQNIRRNNQQNNTKSAKSIRSDNRKEKSNYVKSSNDRNDQGKKSEDVSKER